MVSEKSALKPAIWAMLWIVGVLFAGCDGFFPLQEKTGVPADHTISENGAMHKPGHEYPFRAASGCTDSNCHHSDLRGGVAVVDGTTTIAPSCYQCHGKEWEGGPGGDEDDEDEDDDLPNLLPAH